MIGYMSRQKFASVSAWRHEEGARGPRSEAVQRGRSVPRPGGAEGRLDQVAEDAGIPRATLYYYFSGKDDLVTFFMQEKMEQVATLVQKAKAGEGTALERFEATMRTSVHEMAGNPALCLNLMIATGRMRAMAEVMMATDRAVLAPLRELLIEARAVGDAHVPADIDMTVSALMGGVNMAVIHQWAATGEVDADDMSETIVNQFLDGIRAR
jgi:TetR/AcrR family transcriptional regulator